MQWNFRLWTVYIKVDVHKNSTDDGRPSNERDLCTNETVCKKSHTTKNLFCMHVQCTLCNRIENFKIYVYPTVRTIFSSFFYSFFLLSKNELKHSECLHKTIEYKHFRLFGHVFESGKYMWKWQSWACMVKAQTIYVCDACMCIYSKKGWMYRLPNSRWHRGLHFVECFGWHITTAYV